MITHPHLCTDPRPYRRGGPFEDWQAATVRPSRTGQQVYTFGIPAQPSVVGRVIEVVDSKSVLIQVDGSHRQVYVSMAHCAVDDRPDEESLLRWARLAPPEQVKDLCMALLDVSVPYNGGCLLCGS